MTEHFFHLEGIAAALAILAFAWGVIKWLIEATNTLRTTTKVVNHLYTNHIPHIENALRKVCQKLKIDYDELPPPPVSTL